MAESIGDESSACATQAVPSSSRAADIGALAPEIFVMDAG
jgi:hypothetical protein